MRPSQNFPILPKRTSPRDPAEVERNLKILQRFTEVYCRKHHREYDGNLCPVCHELIGYARARLEHCPYDPKPKCKNCPTHCYNRKYRQQVREIMRFSGMYFIKRGRIDWLIKYMLLGE